MVGNNYDARGCGQERRSIKPKAREGKVREQEREKIQNLAFYKT